MKKYFLGLTAILLAIVFSAFTKPSTLELYLLANKPITTGSVSDGDLWSTGNFGGYAACDINPKDVACEIKLDDATMSSFYHTVSGDKVVNDQAYATAGGATLDYLIIPEAIGLSPDRIINEGVGLRFMHYNTTTQVYDDVTASKVNGTDNDFKNARE
jgi:hypothetical protein